MNVIACDDRNDFRRLQRSERSARTCDDDLVELHFLMPKRVGSESLASAQAIGLGVRQCGNAKGTDEHFPADTTEQSVTAV